MRKEKTVSNQSVVNVEGSQENRVRYFFLLLTLIMLLLIAASPGQAVVGAESTPPVSEQKASPVDTAASRQAVKADAETPKVKQSAAKWRPPPMPEPVPFGIVNISPEKAKELTEKWGVELLGMRLTTAGYMLDFRFRVLDADKALPLFDHRIKPHIVAERSNIKLPVPMAAKVGAFRPTNRGKNIKADKTYYMIFGNPDRHVKVGEKVTVVIGDFKVEHLMVN
jgi:hypothetical protein